MSTLLLLTFVTASSNAASAASNVVFTSATAFSEATLVSTAVLASAGIAVDILAFSTYASAAEFCKSVIDLVNSLAFVSKAAAASSLTVAKAF